MLLCLQTPLPPRLPARSQLHERVHCIAISIPKGTEPSFGDNFPSSNSNLYVAVLQMKQYRKDIAELLRAGKQDYARIRVEAVIREQLTLTGVCWHRKGALVALLCSRVLSHQEQLLLEAEYS